VKKYHAVKSSKPGALARLGSLLRAVVFGHVVVKRGDKGVQLTLSESKAPAAAKLNAGVGGAPASSHPSRAAKPSKLENAEDPGRAQRIERTRAMLVELAVALDPKPANRQVFAALAFLEQQLRINPSGRVFQRLPIKILVKAHEQFVVLCSMHEPLAEGELMRTLVQTLSNRRSEVETAELYVDLHDVSHGGGLFVSEGELKDFPEIEPKR
jgi:hypothetical protein